jgi:two-component system response regulator
LRRGGAGLGACLSDALSSYDRGANSCIRKSVSFEEFVKAIGSLGMFWLVINEPPPR